MLPKHDKPPLRIQPTTLWDYPSQHYGDEVQGDPNYRGATPSYVIWNLLQRYTRPGNVVIDPCCGSGTTLDVCRDLDRRGMGFDIAPPEGRGDIVNADARKLPVEDATADFVFIDPPYSTHLEYSDDPRCIGKLHVKEGYYEAMEQVFAEIYRVLKPDRHMALYVSDSYEHGRGPRNGFHPIGFELFRRLRRDFVPVDVVAVVRHSKTLEMGNYRKAAEEENFFLRGFNYLFILRKPRDARKPAPRSRVTRANAPSPDPSGHPLPKGEGSRKHFTGRRLRSTHSMREGAKPIDAPKRRRKP